ncbi:hypothetical protein SJI00_20870 [Pseudomonas sp. RP23018S]|uniref:hypothetical protein n=1 Tax=Pseudomonas sp. RP23018S TaxID=3096037 RepID=UPI002ACAFF23|nr:hypothetical protein [Pseudomonas sp. RP23018S]MDZ5605229.1 hypothetical protein [Pseudomonas sp. RP23018S]
MIVNKAVGIRLAMVAAAAVLLTAPCVASAASGPLLSTFMEGWKDETKIGLPILLLLIGGLGVLFASWGIISAISTKKQNQPLTWQLFAILGGAAAVVGPIFVLATSGSLTSGQGNGSSQFDDLGIKY